MASIGGPIGRGLARLRLSAGLARAGRALRRGDIPTAFGHALQLRRSGVPSWRAARRIADLLAAIAADPGAAAHAPGLTARLVEAASADPEGFLRRMAAFQFWIDPAAWPAALRSTLRDAAARSNDETCLLFGTSFCFTTAERAMLITRVLDIRALGGTVEAGAPLAFAGHPTRGTAPGTTVTVVMTAFDAARTLAPAVASVLAQSLGDLELLIVDDASRDDTWDAIRRAAASDARVRGLRLARNGGTYRAKNIGLARARGRFLTFHDADDVSHPDKLARQVAALSAATAQGSMSRWIRVSPDGACVASFAGSFVWRNKSSLMVRREVLERIGPFDRVRVSADSEFHERILAAFGPDAVVEIDEPLSLGLVRPDSLTQAAATRMTHTFVAPVRIAYERAYRAWHAAAPADALFMRPDPRPFEAPEPLLSGAEDDEVAEET